MGGQSASIGERVGGVREWGAFPALTDCVSTGFIIQLLDTADKLSFLVAATLKKILSPRWNPRSNGTCGESVCGGWGSDVRNRIYCLHSLPPPLSVSTSSQSFRGRIPTLYFGLSDFPKPKHVSSLGK